VSRLREKGSKCEFDAEELSERIIEMIILSTPFDEFRKELLTKAKKHPITTVLERAAEYEAILASQTSLRSLHSPASAASSSASVDHIRQHAEHAQASAKPCRNCGTQHHQRKCPAAEDTCSYLLCTSGGHA
jgi:hypothetical protein